MSHHGIDGSGYRVSGLSLERDFEIVVLCALVVVVGGVKRRGGVERRDDCVVRKKCQVKSMARAAHLPNDDVAVSFVRSMRMEISVVPKEKYFLDVHIFSKNTYRESIRDVVLSSA